MESNYDAPGLIDPNKPKGPYSYYIQSNPDKSIKGILNLLLVDYIADMYSYAFFYFFGLSRNYIYAPLNYVDNSGRPLFDSELLLFSSLISEELIIEFTNFYANLEDMSY